MEQRQTITEEQILDLHGLYQTLTGLEVPLTFGRRYQWEVWALNGWNREDLAVTIEHLRKKIREGVKTIACFRFSTLIGNTEFFGEDLAEARALARRPKINPGRAQVLKATGRPEKIDPPPAKPARDVLAEAKALAEFRKWKEQNL